MIPERAPRERADQYLERLRTYESLEARARKEAIRAERRINSEVERILIERAVKKALRGAPRGSGINPRAMRYYSIPRSRALIPLGIFSPLFILISLVFQNITRVDNRYKTGISISQGDPDE